MVSDTEISDAIERLERDFALRRKHIIDLDYLDKVCPVSNPWAHKLIATIFLRPQYSPFYKRVNIRFEGEDNVPKDEPVIFAMNHTDRYNYWPFQYKLWRSSKFKKHQYTAVWVKTKYYSNKISSKFFDMCNGIPVSSKKDFIRGLFLGQFGVRLLNNDYSIIKDYANDMLDKEESLDKVKGDHKNIEFILNHAKEISIYHKRMMEKVGEISVEALGKGLNLIIFPEGTRSTKLDQGRTSIAQLALHSKHCVIPIGCSGSDLVYDSNYPFANSGEIIYRIGEPIRTNHNLDSFKMFSTEFQREFKELFEKTTMIIMNAIKELVYDKYVV